MNNTIKKIIAIAAVSAITIGIPANFTNTPFNCSITASAASTTGNIVTYKDTQAQLRYQFVPHTDGKTCTLYRISNFNNERLLTTKTDVIIPDKLKDSSGKQYTITELGYDGQSIIHNYDNANVRVKSVTLPKQTKRINRNAFTYTEISSLQTISINLEALEYCDEYAFSQDNNLVEVNAYSASRGRYVSTSSDVESFNEFFGITNADFKKNSNASDHFIPVSNNLNGKLTLINAISASPYGQEIAIKFANKIADEKGFKSSELSELQRYEMIYNYIVSHNKYSEIDINDNGNIITLERLEGSSLSNLAFHSGVCGSFACSFELLNRVCGIETYNVTAPGHALNAVKVGNEFFKVDCVADIFMQGKISGGNSNINIYYPTNRTETLSDKGHLGGYSYIKIADNTDKNFNITLTDMSNPNKKYIDYISYAESSGALKLDQIKSNKLAKQYIDSNTYYTLQIKYGNNVVDIPYALNVSGEKNTEFYVDGVKYNCNVKIVKDSDGPHSSNADCFSVVINRA